MQRRQQKTWEERKDARTKRQMVDEEELMARLREVNKVMKKWKVRDERLRA